MEPVEIVDFCGTPDVNGGSHEPAPVEPTHQPWEHPWQEHPWHEHPWDEHVPGDDHPWDEHVPEHDAPWCDTGRDEDSWDDAA
jgi:hypothetical protein